MVSSFCLAPDSMHAHTQIPYGVAFDDEKGLHMESDDY